MTKVTRVHNVVSIADKKRKKKSKEDFKRMLTKPPDGCA